MLGLGTARINVVANVSFPIRVRKGVLHPGLLTSYSIQAGSSSLAALSALFFLIPLGMLAMGHS